MQGFQNDHVDQFLLKTEDQHELFLKLSDLENQRKDQALSSINAKSLIRLNKQRINTFNKQVEKKRKLIKIQNNRIQDLKALIKEFIDGIKQVQNARTRYEEYLKSQQNEFKQNIDQFHSQSESSSSVYKHINEIPSDPSQASDESKQSRKFNKGAWTEKERYKYFQFIDENRDIFDNIELRYKEKIFVQLSKVIGTRTTKQCRCFHNQLIHRSKQNDQILQQMQQ